MVTVGATTIVVLVVVIFFFRAMRRPSSEVIIDHFWYFTFLWLLFFPIRALLLANDWVDMQIPQQLTDAELLAALIVSFVLWGASYLGANAGHPANAMPQGLSRSLRNSHRAEFIRWGLLIGAWILLFELYIGQGITRFSGTDQNELRTSSGPFFLFQHLYLYGFFTFIGFYICAHGRLRRRGSLPLLYFVLVLLTSLLFSNYMQSRRIIAEPIFAIAILWLLMRRKSGRADFGKSMLVVAMTVFAAPILQIARYLDFRDALSSDIPLSAAFVHLLDMRFYLTAISSSFEGIDHLARFISNRSAGEFWLGGDFGVSWLYNGILGMVPRAVWVDKPEIYGSLAQQYFLYPEMFIETVAVTTIPASYAVDFMFGFGLLGAVPAAFVLGRTLRIMKRWLWRHEGPVKVTVSIFIFISMFNILRAGTGFIQLIVQMLLICIFIFGLKQTITSLFPRVPRVTNE